MRRIIDCKELKNKQIEELKRVVDEFKYSPVLSIIQVAGDKASDTYTRNKVNLAEEVGIKAIHIVLQEDISLDELAKTIVTYQAISNGIILQLPLPEHLKPHTQALLDMIDSSKDVDALSTKSIGMLHSGNALYYPATAQACLDVLDDIKYDLTGKTVLIVGRQSLLGYPLHRMMTDRNATVTLAHSKTKNLDLMMGGLYDVVVVATGKAKYFKSVVAEVILDVGINRDENGKLCGDVDLSDSEFAYATTVGGGIGGLGQLTCLNLLKNAIKSYQLNTQEVL